MPTDTYDRSFPYYQWWPKKGGTEWISYEYENPKKCLHLLFTGTMMDRGEVAAFLKTGNYTIKICPETGIR